LLNYIIIIIVVIVIVIVVVVVVVVVVGRSGFQIPGGAGTFSLHHRVQKGSEAHPAYSMGTGGSFPGARAAGRETDHSPPSSAEVKNAWSYTITPPICLHGVAL
jgi:flagellar basal body-associated protein FliL